jgi:mono/diheme cytochrome c family protein
MWDDRAMATLELPLAEPTASPKYPPADYYYRIPVRPIYKSYPIYAPGHEPPDYLDWLKQQEPVVIWDGAGHAPTLNTGADWIKAGEMVFDSPVAFNAPAFGGVNEVRDPVRYEKLGVPVDKDGIMPFARYVIRKKGEVEVGQGSCAMCHTRVLPDGSILKGAQGNNPNQRVAAYEMRKNFANARGGQRPFGQVPAVYRSLWATPWLRPDPLSQIARMTTDEFASFMEATPPGVDPRGGSSVFHPIQLPDLIGVKDRLYLDHTGLQQHRSIADMMRYAALNQGADSLGNYGGFVPADRVTFQHVPDPDKVPNGRYSDDQLYALALYVYSLEPPANPNKPDEVAAPGQKIFEREGCAGCHTPPLYTNNKLTPAESFAVPEDDKKNYDILPISLGTDSNLTLKTRRGTGYYKVPSLKGVWYRGMFPHDGSCATLEDWFDPRRLRDDYVPTGFKGYAIQTRAVKGHEFGLKLSADDKRALIAFLKTL